LGPQNFHSTSSARRLTIAGRVLHLVLDPKDPRKLYAGTEYDGVYTFTRR